MTKSFFALIRNITWFPCLSVFADSNHIHIWNISFLLNWIYGETTLWTLNTHIGFGLNVGLGQISYRLHFTHKKTNNVKWCIVMEFNVCHFQTSQRRIFLLDNFQLLNSLKLIKTSKNDKVSSKSNECIWNANVKSNCKLTIN